VTSRVCPSPLSPLGARKGLAFFPAQKISFWLNGGGIDEGEPALGVWGFGGSG